MCFNSQVSLLTFSLGTIFSLALYKLKYPDKQNQAFGIFFIFISLIQFMDFIFWIDLNNTFQLNKFMTILGPILNVCQPIILYLIKYYIYKPNIFKSYDFSVLVLNMLYIMYFISAYIKFIKDGQIITRVVDGHLSWPWLKYSSPFFYLLMLTINIYYLSDFKYSSIIFLVIGFFLYISAKYFNKHIGELWCFFGSFLPLIFYIIFK